MPVYVYQSGLMFACPCISPVLNESPTISNVIFYRGSSNDESHYRIKYSLNVSDSHIVCLYVVVDKLSIF